MRPPKALWRWLLALPPAGGLAVSCLLLSMAPAASASASFPVDRTAASMFTTTIATSSAARAQARLSSAVHEHAEQLQEVRMRAERERHRAALAAVQKPQPKTRRAATSPAPQAGGSPPSPGGCGLAGNLSFAQLEQLWQCAGGPGWAASSAASVAECESGGQQYAQNPSGASGYFQILGQVIPGNIFDPVVNAENAVAKFTASGDTWAQWVCQP